jgi:hypothetical protein
MSLTFRYVGRVIRETDSNFDHGQGGDKIPRKGGPGISQSDLLVINKVSTSMIGSMYYCLRMLQSPRLTLPLM